MVRVYQKVTPGDVLAFLGATPSPHLSALAEEHIRVVTTFIRSYTRGNGFSEGIPCEDLRDVIIPVTARYMGNPQQLTRQAAGTQNVAYASLDGFTLAELAVLHLYRRRSA